MSMIQIVDLHKSFGAQKVLNGVNLTIQEGSLTVILGRSGEGKSVLLRHIIGLMRADSGHIWVQDEDLMAMSDRKLNQKRKLFGMLFQYAALFDSFTVYENVAFPLREHTNLSQKEITKLVEEKLALVGLVGVSHKLPSEISGGMRKRVGLARAIALTPKILLYDEPTTGLDPLMTHAVDELIVNTQKNLNVTSVVISHDIESTFRIADQIAMLHEGQIVASGTPEEIRKFDHPFLKRFIGAQSV